MDDRRLIALLPIVFILGSQFGRLRTEFRVQRLLKRVGKESDTLMLAWNATSEAVDRIAAGQDPEEVQRWFAEQKSFIDTVRESM